MTPPNSKRRLGNQTPTLHIHKDGGENLYDSVPIVKKDIADWVSKPFPWQELVYRDIFTIAEDGSLQYKVVCLSVPRRNGKTEIILGTMMIFAILFGAKVLYTAQIQDTADDIYSRFMDLLEKPGSRLKLYFPGIQRKTRAGELVVQAYDPKTGKALGTLEFRGRKGDKGRGITRDVIIIDEAQDYSQEQEQRFGSINGSSEIGLTLMVGTPPPLDSNPADAASWRTTRAEAKSQEDLPWETRSSKETAWIEWGADAVKNKSDKDAWYRNNPSMGYLPRKALSESWFANRPSSMEVFSVENLGYWSSQLKDRAIDVSSFNRLAVTGEELKVGTKGAKFAIGIKSNREDNQIHMGIAFRREDGKIAYLHVQTFYRDEEGYDKLLESLLIGPLKKSQCVAVYIDGPLAISTVQPILIRHGLWHAKRSRIRQGKIAMASMTDIARACSDLTTAIASKRLVHQNPEPLHAAVEDAGKRKIGESGFGFITLSGLVDVIPLEVCALAVYGVESRAQIRSTDMTTDISSTLQRSLGAL